MSKTTRWRSAALLGLPVALLLALAGPAAAAAPPAPTPGAAGHRPPAGGAPRVPAPTGHQPVGVTDVRLVDDSRPDPWRAGTPSRELMVTVRYPTGTTRGSHPAYVSPELSDALYRGLFDASTVRTNALADAPPARGRLPLVVLSPGFGNSRTSLTALSEDLASRGYAVAVVDHTYETSVQFPDGRIEPCLICGEPEDPWAFGVDVSRSRARDLRFVIDRFTAPGRGPVRGLSIDPARIGAAGHSLGGAGSLEAMREDGRIRAAANLDGTVFVPPAEGLSRPVLLLSARLGGSAESTANWEDTWNRLGGWRRWLDLPEAGHLSFSDVHWQVDAFGVRDQLPPELADESFGTIRGTRALAATRAYLGAFLDRHLRDRPGPLLDRPSRAYPDVRFVK
ncbi:alpha/beta hydrolase [Kitasatospora sp. NPDC002965]|uniref:alpha/beta hydrolase family protein n=1 Tax=Kitasatospora sp. NPDC002965 TaxID=3154775 RepID=UPI0033BAD52F